MLRLQHPDQLDLTRPLSIRPSNASGDKENRARQAVTAYAFGWAMGARVPDAVRHSYAAPQSRDRCEGSVRYDPGSAAHRFALRSVRGTLA
jgi:hypothetical protein